MCNTESIFLFVSTSEAEPPPLLHITTLTTEVASCGEPKEKAQRGLVNDINVGNVTYMNRQKNTRNIRQFFFVRYARIKLCHSRQQFSILEHCCDGVAEDRRVLVAY